jgi:hypothetical protein
LVEGTDIVDSAIYPGLGERWQRPRSDALGIRVPAKSIRRLAEKIVRGIFFVEDQMFIEPPTSIEFVALTEDGAAPIKSALDRFGTEHSRGAGIVVRRAAAPGSDLLATFEISIWKEFVMYATVTDSAAQLGR